MADLKPIKSSNLIAASYDPETQKATVQFKNGSYDYPGVKPDVWEGFQSTFQTDASSGGYFAKHIKPLGGTKSE